MGALLPKWVAAMAEKQCITPPHGICCLGLPAMRLPDSRTTPQACPCLRRPEPMWLGQANFCLKFVRKPLRLSTMIRQRNYRAIVKSIEGEGSLGGEGGRVPVV